MSEEESTPNTKEDPGLLETVGESLGFDIDRIKAEIHGEQHETGPAETNAKGPVTHPTDEEIVDLAVDALVEQKQRNKAANHPDIEDHRNVQVEVDIEEPHILVHEFAQSLYEESEELLGYLYDNSLFDVTGPSLEEDDEELVTYIIEERDEDDEERPAAFLGGAQPLRINLGKREGLTEDERLLVKLAHTAAARQNGYDRHLLLDEVLVVPLEDPGKNPYAQG